MMFEFYDPGPLSDDDLRLVLSEMLPIGPKVEAPTYCFTMRIAGQEEVIGRINLRAADTDNIRLYRGHIGYSVEPAFQGHRYALRSCRLLFPLAQNHHLSPLWITCDPDNWASRRTCELLEAVFVEIVDVAEDTPAYRHGARRKCRYRLDL